MSLERDTNNYYSITQGCKNMGKKGTPHRRYSKEEKMKYVRLHLEEHLSAGQIEREYGIGNALVSQLGQEVPGGRRGRSGAS